MSSSDKSLDALMQEQLVEGAFELPNGRNKFMEIVDRATGLVWMCTSPMSESEFDALEFEKDLVKVGIAETAMDRSAFQHSPGQPDKRVQERIINSYLFINVSDPSKPHFSPHPEGAAEVSVNKNHVIGFDAGRDLAILSMPQGEFVELLGSQEHDYSRVLPVGGSLRQITLQEPWVITLPTPTTSFFWFLTQDIRTFQGPVILPDSI
ncbi:MAG: hypothetical protein ACI9JM_002446 [Halioglobus sp.]|jgi:hypothetical protein